MKYYLAVNGQPVGPYEPQELLQQGLTANSQVWNETMTGWQPAGQVPELAALLTQNVASQMPSQPNQPFPAQQQYQQPQYGGAHVQQGAPNISQPTGVRPQLGFMEAVKTCVVEKYCDFNGRARRSEYWWYVLGYQILSWVVNGIFFATIRYEDLINDPMSLYTSPGMIVMSIIGLALLLPSLGVSVRRLHDTGRSGLWLLLMLIPCVNLVFAILLIVWMCQDSQPMTNEYGPSPKYQ